MRVLLILGLIFLAYSPMMVAMKVFPEKFKAHQADCPPVEVKPQALPTRFIF